MTEVVVGVDAGTSMIKAVAFSPEGEALCVSRRENEVLAPRQGWREQDMDDTWDATAATLRAVVDELDDEEVVGVGVTGQGDGCWLLDDAGRPVRDAVLWSDGRATDVTTEWQESGVNDDLYEICGSVQFPGSSLAILQWLEENEPDAVERAETVLFCKDWLKYCLTGERTSDPSDMSLPYLDVATGEYAPEVFEVVGSPDRSELFPPLADPTEVIGGVTGEAAERTGLPEGTPVVSGLFDIPASLYGTGAARPGEGTSIVGTTALNAVVLDELDTSPRGVGYTVSLGTDRGWSRIMSSMIGTPNLDWALETFGYGDDPDYDAVEREVADVPVGCEGVLYHPYLSSAGERAPFLDARARAQFVGLEPDHTRAHLVRAVYEGVALAMRDCYEHVPLTPGEVYVAGGGASSTVWCEMFASCTGAEFLAPAGEEFGAKGAALLAGTAAGVYDDLETAVAETRTVDRSFHPDPADVRRYDALYEWYRATYEAMFDVWGEREAALEALDGSGD